MDKAVDIFEAAIKAEEVGDSAEALRLYEQASLLAPTNPHPRLRMAVLLRKERRYQHAIGVGRQITKRWPRVVWAYYVVADSYAQLGRWTLAERFYRQALAVKQKPEFLVLLSSVLRQLERDDEAEECLRKALRVDPDYEEAHYNLGGMFKEQGKFAPAEEHFRRAIEIDPKYALAYAELGSLLSSDRPQEAISFLRKAVNYDPNDGWSMAYLAEALSRLGKLKAADRQYRRLLELWPNEAISNWCYGSFLASNSNDASTAEKYLRKAVEIAPRDQYSNYYLGKHLLYWSRTEEARIFLMKAARMGHSRASELLRLSLS